MSAPLTTTAAWPTLRPQLDNPHAQYKPDQLKPFAITSDRRWGRETFDHLVGLVHSDEAVQAGVQLCYAHCLFLAPEPDPFWASSVHGFRRMSAQVCSACWLCLLAGCSLACLLLAELVAGSWELGS